jgi:hypothetical protein
MKKVIVLFVIGLLIIIGIIFINKNQHESSPSVPATAVKPSGIVKTAQMQAAEGYFEAFTTCTKNPPSEAAGQVTVYCETHNTYATDTLGAHLEKQKESVVCSQTAPKTVSAIRSTEINGNQALVIIREDFGNSKTNVTYQMQRVDGVWKVENILCPK